jgi:hypothetical protein
MKTRLSLALVIVMLTSMTSGSAFADQPNMKEALAHLRSARAALMRAVPNKGGHRERALEHVDRAISEVQAGMAFAR